MKTKILIFLAVSTLISLSFTFSSFNAGKKTKNVEAESEVVANAPIGGIASEDKL